MIVLVGIQTNLQQLNFSTLLFHQLCSSHKRYPFIYSLKKKEGGGAPHFHGHLEQSLLRVSQSHHDHHHHHYQLHQHHCLIITVSSSSYFVVMNIDINIIINIIITLGISEVSLKYRFRCCPEYPFRVS